MKKAAIGLLLPIAIVVYFAWPRDTTFDWRLPQDIPPPRVPADNPMNDAKVALGRWLFYDRRLSGNGTIACASCHEQSLAFTDGRARAVGSTGALHPRGSMTLVNAAYASRLTWANPLLDRLEDQALTPLFGDNPVEMGLGGRENTLPGLLRTEPRYRDLTRKAFPADADPYSVLNGVRAIAAFVRSIVSFDAPYDRWLAGDTAAMSEAAVRGMTLFFSERAECFHCHGGFNFTDSSTHANASVARVGFHNTGLYNLGGRGDYPQENTGLFDMTGQRRDMGRFKAPTLRNIALTAPYMHDGSVASLADAVAHYERGGRQIMHGEHAGDGRLNPYKSEFVRGFELSDAERRDLIAFLHALTDESMLRDPRWSNPFAR